MREKGARAEAQVARVAERQHGLITRRQLIEVGIAKNAIAAWVQRGRLHRLHHGVYAVGHAAPSHRRDWMAAVLACGDGAVLSHRSAAELWGLLDRREGPVEVSVPTYGGRRGRKGLRIHRRASLRHASLLLREGEEPIPALTRRDAIPVTAPWLTIEDLHGAVPPKLYRRAVRQAELRRFVLSPRTQRDRTRSDAERDFLALCERYGLPAPAVNLPVGRWTVDFLWPAQRLVVETDSWATHGSSVAFEDDHQRDLDLRARGYTVCHYTEAQVRHQPRHVAADLADALRPD